MHITIVSGSLRHLRRDDMNTSSQLFQWDFAIALASYAHVTIISTVAAEDAQRDGIALVASRRRSRNIGMLSAIRRRRLLTGPDSTLILFGYNPANLFAARFATWWHGGRVVAYVFDGHEGAIETFAPPKKLLANTYFQIGRRLLRVMDGVILVNSRAASSLRLSDVPHLVSRIGTLPVAIPLHPRSSRNPRETYRMLYAGSLEAYNGLEPLIEAFSRINDRSLRLEILGDGSLSGRVAAAAAKDSRIEFRGRVSRGDVAARTSDADLLINLRDLNHPIAKYSFPSKLIEYMASMTPVLTSPVLSDPDLSQSVFLVHSLEPASIKDAIITARGTEDVDGMVRSAYDYVATKHAWADIGHEVALFLSGLGKRETNSREHAE